MYTKHKQDQNWIDPKLAGLQITGILHKIETNEMIKSWSKFIQWSKYDQNSYNDQVMIKNHPMIKLWWKFIQWSKHDQNSYNGQTRSINIFKDQKLSLKNWLE